LTELKNNGKTNELDDSKTFPLWVFISFAMGDVFIQLYVYLFSVRTFDFYENEVGLATGIIALAFIIFALWNMINDPLIGFLSDKPRNFWRKWGKRTPFVIIGGIGTTLSFIFIFAVPDVDPKSDWLILFIWLLVSICLFDTLFSTMDTNYISLVPDKFRTDKLRLRLAGFQVGLGIFGTVLAVVVSPMFIVYGQQSSFLTMAIIVGIIGIVLILLLIYGIHEDKAMIENYFIAYEKAEKVKFTEVLKVALKQKSFVAFLVVYMLYQTTVSLLLGSIPYLVRFILNGEAIIETYILLGYIVAGILSVPIWWKIALKKGNNKTVFIIGGLIWGLASIPFLFITTVLAAIILAIILGIGMIGFWLMLNPIISDVIDEAISESGIRQEGVYMGVRTFFGRIAIMLQAIIFALVHIFTGFTPGSATQSPTAIFGLRLQMSVIPAIIMIIGILVFWKLYDITPEKKEITRKKLQELNL